MSYIRPKNSSSTPSPPPFPPTPATLHRREASCTTHPLPAERSRSATLCACRMGGGRGRRIGKDTAYTRYLRAGDARVRGAREPLGAQAGGEVAASLWARGMRGGAASARVAALGRLVLGGGTRRASTVRHHVARIASALLIRDTPRRRCCVPRAWQALQCVGGELILARSAWQAGARLLAPTALTPLPGLADSTGSAGARVIADLVSALRARQARPGRHSQEPCVRATSSV
jgi:hypothetical protein